jgi:hypothetical protein
VAEARAWRFCTRSAAAPGRSFGSLRLRAPGGGTRAPRPHARRSVAFIGASSPVRSAASGRAAGLPSGRTPARGRLAAAACSSTSTRETPACLHQSWLTAPKSGAALSITLRLEALGDGLKPSPNLQDRASPRTMTRFAHGSGCFA